MKYFVIAVMTVGLVAGLGMFQAAFEDKPKYTIEEVMEKAHSAPKGKDSLYKKVVNGKATKEQKKQLLEMYESLAKNKPEKGTLEDWKKRTANMVKAAKSVVDDKKDATKELMKAVACKACHDLHKGEEE